MKKNLSVTQKQLTKEEQLKIFWRTMKLATNLGFMIVLPMVGGLFLGLFLDNNLGTKPVLTLVLLTGGLILGSASVVIRVKEL
jgi:F0F1-type ATP synthase assembly protein I